MRDKKENSDAKRPSFYLAFLRNEAEHQQANGHLTVADHYDSAARSFSQFLATRQLNDVQFQKLTPLLVADYEAWLQTHGLCKNSTSFYLRNLQAVYNKAVRRGLTADQTPFAGTYRGVARTVKRAVASSEVARLSSLDIRQALLATGDYVEGRRLDNMLRWLTLARDLFIFCFCARGLTFVDLAYLRKSAVSGNLLTYVRRKTRQRIEVQLEPMMLDILRRYPSSTDYLLPILTKTSTPDAVYHQYRYALCRYNKHLHLLGQLMGGLRLTSYVCRHSWASAAHQQGVSLQVISQSMGHNSEKTTEIYLQSIECNAIHQANRELLEGVFR